MADDLTVAADASEQLGEDLLEVVSEVDPDLEGATQRVAEFSLEECGVDFAELRFGCR